MARAGGPEETLHTGATSAASRNATRVSGPSWASMGASPLSAGAVARLDMVPTSVALATAEAALMNKLGREFRLRDQLAGVVDEYDFIFIDTPPSLGLLTINALVAAQLVLVPTEARFFSLQGLQMLQESIDEILYINPNLRILGIVLSKYDRRLREEQTVATYLREHWGDLVFDTSVGTNSKILEAASAGVPLVELGGSQRAAEMYRSLAEEVLARV